MEKYPSASLFGQTKQVRATSTAVRTCLRKAGLGELVRVMEVPSTNLKGRLVRNRLYESRHAPRHPVLSARSEVKETVLTSEEVYLITCSQCGKGYIGEANRPLAQG